MSDLSAPVEYRFSFQKKSAYKGKALFNINSSGSFTLEKEEVNADETCLKFTNTSYKSSNTNDPLLFSPVEWKYGRNLDVAAITNKKSFKPKWNRFRDKYRNPNNRVLLMVIEKLYFNTPLGMEYDTFSNGVYLPFFIASDGNYELGQQYKGLDYVSMPLDIPLETVFECKRLNDKETHLEGWVTLHEPNLDALLMDQGFKAKAKDYHISRDFSIDSKIELVIDRPANIIKHISCRVSIKGEQELMEEITYTVDSDFDSYQGGIHKIVDDKKYTLEQWEEYEREQRRPGRNFSLLDGE